jgi:hypothetical protein
VDSVYFFYFITTRLHLVTGDCKKMGVFLVIIGGLLLALGSILSVSVGLVCIGLGLTILKNNATIYDDAGINTKEIK